MSLARKLPVHPALIRHAEERAGNLQNRIADIVTRFAGSMPFVYLHAVWFVTWIVAGVEDYPFGLLTMIVSLEAIFLSTFVMISQNRADEKRQALADHQWQLVQLEKQQNDELLQMVDLERKQNEDILELAKRILDMTTQVHDLTNELNEKSQA